MSQGDWAIVISIVTIGTLNLIVFSYAYGKLTQRVQDLISRVKTIEEWKERVSVIWIKQHNR